MRLHSPFAAALATLAVAASNPGCGGEAQQPSQSEDPPTHSAAPHAPSSGGDARQGRGPGDGAEPPARGTAPGDRGGRPAPEARIAELEREAAATVRAYVSALDSRNGRRVCALLAPGAIESVELPVPRRGCAASLEASIGFRDPRGLPVWEGAEVLEVRSVKADGSEATVVATVMTRFADRAEPSIEDDVVYLTRRGGDWMVAKPSATLFRAVGVADVPPVVLAPPRERS